MFPLAVTLSALATGSSQGTPAPTITSFGIATPGVAAATTSATTAAFTPTANSQLFACVTSRATNAQGSASTCVDSLGGTWSLVKETYLNNGSNLRLRNAVLRSSIGGSPASMTVTGGQAQALYTNVVVIQVVGASTSITNIAPDATDAAGDPTATLPTAPAGSDGAIASFCGQGNSTPSFAGEFTSVGNTSNTSSLTSGVGFRRVGPPQSTQVTSTNSKAVVVYFALSPA